MEKKSNAAIKARLIAAVSDPLIREKTFADFVYTFEQIGLSKKGAESLAEKVLTKLIAKNTMGKTENAVRALFKKTKDDKGVPFFELLEKGLRGREKKIVTEQIGSFFKGVLGRVIDFGAGSGEIAQCLHDLYKINIDGVDVRDFKNKGVTIPILVFDGKKVPVKDSFYEAALMTNVAHHEENNEDILQELTRIVRKKLVIIETVPADESRVEWERTFVNDVLWNRFFNYADIPVPGKYELPANWIRRFTKYGWKLTYSKDLGYDQPTIRDLHYLLVFER